MFEKKPELQKIHKDLAAYADTLNRGDTMPMSQIERISGVVRYGEHWNHIVKKLKAHLFSSRGIVIWPKFNGSYSLLTDQEQSNEYPRWQQKAARRRIRRTIRALDAVDDSKLNVHQRNAKNRQAEYLAYQSKQLYRGIHEGKQRKTPTLPRRILAEV